MAARPAPTSRASACTSRAACAASLVQKTAPRDYTQHARNPERIGADRRQRHGVRAGLRPALRARSRRAAGATRTIEDFRNFVKLAYMAPSIHHSGGTVCEPVDVPVNKRHLDMVYCAHPLFATSRSWARSPHPSAPRTRVDDGQDRCSATISSTSNTRADQPDQRQLADGLGRHHARRAEGLCARTTRPCIVTPFILAGAMSPVTVAGTLTQVLAEVLAGAAFTQLVRPGAPVIFGTFASSISMQSGAPTFGTPEPSLVLLRRGAARAPARPAVPHRRLALRLEGRRRAGGL